MSNPPGPVFAVLRCRSQKRIACAELLVIHAVEHLRPEDVVSMRRFDAVDLTDSMWNVSLTDSVLEIRKTVIHRSRHLQRTRFSASVAAAATGLSILNKQGRSSVSSASCFSNANVNVDSLIGVIIAQGWDGVAAIVSSVVPFRMTVA